MKKLIIFISLIILCFNLEANNVAKKKVSDEEIYKSAGKYLQKIFDLNNGKIAEEIFLKFVEKMSIENHIEVIKDIAVFSEKYKSINTDYFVGIGLYNSYYLSNIPENLTNELLDRIISEVKTAKPDNLYMFALLDALNDKNLIDYSTYNKLFVLVNNLQSSIKKCNNFDKIEFSTIKFKSFIGKKFYDLSESQQLELSEKIIKLYESIDFNPNKNLTVKQVDDRKGRNYIASMTLFASAETRNRYRNYYRQQFKKELDAKEANNKSKNKIIDEEDIYMDTKNFYQTMLVDSAEDRKFVLNEYRKKNYKIKPASKDFYKVPTVEEIQKSQSVSE